jgi:hypothetical protein
MAIAAPRKLDSRTAEQHLSLELLARRQEAGMFAVALRTVVRQLEGVLLIAGVRGPARGVRAHRAAPSHGRPLRAALGACRMTSLAVTAAALLVLVIAVLLAAVYVSSAVAGGVQQIAAVLP